MIYGISQLRENVRLNCLVINRAGWHKSYHRIFSQDKVVTARKRAAVESVQDCRVIKRSCLRLKWLIPVYEFFCEEFRGILHEISTLSVDTNVRNITSDPQDSVLLVNIGGGHLIALIT